ncbi:hypothetical protein GW943_03205 [Candidatus Parcubacteria bacterium]|nr:hypothetical protein [Candidatus Parcubacteria bacterium]
MDGTGQTLLLHTMFGDVHACTKPCDKAAARGIHSELCANGCGHDVIVGKEGGNYQYEDHFFCGSDCKEMWKIRRDVGESRQLALPL